VLGEAKKKSEKVNVGAALLLHATWGGGGSRHKWGGCEKDGKAPHLGGKRWKGPGEKRNEQKPMKPRFGDGLQTGRKGARKK